MRHQLGLLLLFPILAFALELRLSLKAKLLQAPAEQQVVEINVTNAEQDKRMLLGLKVEDRTNLRFFCLAADRDVNAAGTQTIKRLMALEEDNCSAPENANRITLSTDKNASLVPGAAAIAYLELPAHTQVRVLWNGKAIHEGPVDSSLVLDGGNRSATPLQGLQSLILASVR